MLGFSSMVVGVGTVDVYLAPDVAGGAVERMHHTAESPLHGGVERTRPQLAVFCGRRHDNDTLRSVVTFVRSMPQLQLRDFSTKVGTLPIEGITARPKRRAVGGDGLRPRDRV